MAGKRRLEWEDHLDQVLLTKPAEVVLEACQVLEKHGCRVKEELESELYYSSTLCQVVFAESMISRTRGVGSATHARHLLPITSSRQLKPLVRILSYPPGLVSLVLIYTHQPPIGLLASAPAPGHVNHVYTSINAVTRYGDMICTQQFCLASSVL